ncbi:MAG TPA: tripartite tricarboxylate transporter TctB family protein, partial [Aestuariivirgaceae bacterium]|nr:tripartite tricarboxylate transporter TctB family protein [Aestuariivirgaceae bacterium]
MTPQRRDRLAGSILLVFAGLWCWGAATMIPAGVGQAPVGPRGFPLGLGLLLAALSAMLVASSFIGQHRDAADEAPQETPLSIEAWAVASTLSILIGYGAMMYATGFIIATAVTVTAALVLILGKRSWRLVGGLSLGTAFGAYIIFNKVLGVYLPHGRWL